MDTNSEASSNGASSGASSSEPRRYKSLMDIYNTTEEVELEDNELLFAGSGRTH